MRAIAVIVITGLALSLGLASSVAVAQESVGIEEIVVTAQKREQSLQDVPVSMVAFDSDMLTAIGADSLDDLTLRTPNVNFEKWDDIKLATPTVRGVFGSNTGGTEMGMGIYVDEVIMGTSVAGALHLYDIERVEMLRGPQGTLFGRNTTAGALAYTTRKASVDEMDGYISLNVGDYNLKRVTGAISGPLAQGKLGGRLAFVYHDREGWTDNVNLGTKVNSESYYAVRGSLRYEPSERSTWDLSVDYRNLDQEPLQYEIVVPNPILEFGIPAFPGGPTFQFTSDGDPWNYSMSENEVNIETMDGFGSKLTGVISFDNFDFSTITAYRQHEYFNSSGTDRTPIDWAVDGDPEDQNQLSQEFRLTSSGEQSFDWILGAFFFTQDTDNISFATLGADLSAWIGLPPVPLEAVASGVVEADSAALYGQGVFHFGDKLDLTVGLRLNHDKKSIVYSQTDESAQFIPGGLVGVVDEYSRSDSWTEPTGDITLSYRFSEDVMAYFKAANGYKAGGYNDALGSADDPAFGPEFVTNLEAGIRTTFLDNRIMLNATAFHMEWTDIQISAFTTVDRGGQLVFGVLTGNFGEAKSDGLEVEFQAAATDKLSFYATAGLLDAEFTTGDPTLPGEDPIISPGNQLPGPISSFTGGLTFDQPVGQGLISFGTDYVWTGERELIGSGTDGNNPAGHQEPFGLWNARLFYTGANDRWSVGVWGKNLTDEIYVTRVADFTFPPILSVFQNLGSPRMYGAELTFNF